MAAKFLSEEWARVMTEALNSSEEFVNAASGQQVKLQQVVTDAPGRGEEKFYFTLSGGRADVGLGEMPGVDATLTQNYETASGIFRGDLNPQVAFMQGKLKVAGNMMKLMQLQGVMSAMPNAIRGLDVEY